MRLVHSLLLATLTTLTSGCAYDVQTTSGAAYLARNAPSQPMLATGQPDNPVSVSEALASVAAMEPRLTFPARIGLARIEHGGLTSIPAAETKAWMDLQARLGDGWGTFVPVSPLIAELAQGSATTRTCRGCSSPVTRIRLGAAAQHLDAVLIYEVHDLRRDDSNFLSVANVTILGGFLLPTTTLTSETTVQAMLIDVMQGYPYGQVQVSQSEDELTTTWGNDGTRQDLHLRTRQKALEALTADVENMLKEVRWRLAEQRTAAPSRTTGRL